MAANIKVFPNATMTDLDFAMLIEALTPGKSGMIYGCNLNSVEGSTNKVHVVSGWVIVRGRLVRVEAFNLDIPLPQSGTKTKHIMLTVRLSNTENPAEIYSCDDGEVPKDSERFNPADGEASIELGTVVASNKGLSNISTSIHMPYLPVIRTGTSDPSIKDGSKPGDIYFRYKK